MNTIDILKGILVGNATKSRRIDDLQKRSGGRSSGGVGGLGDILGSVLGGGHRQAEPPPQRREEPTDPGELGSMLEDMLGVGRNEPARRREVPRAAPPQRQPEPRFDVPARRGRPEVDQAEILVRAMCNAAKVDGQIDRSEQDAILSRIGNVGREEIDFVRSELNASLDLEAFCRSVPREAAQHAYAFSLLAIKLDTLKEAAYLGRLGAGLGLEPEVCNQIHKQLDAPCLYAG